MINKESVINTSTGDLLRFGYEDFENDGSFDSGTESIRTDQPEPCYRKDKPDDNGKWHRWNGSTWGLVS